MFIFSNRPRVAVLRGGPSPEYEVSLKTGGNILSNLPEECEAVDVLISKDGVWHEKGYQKNPQQILAKIDLVVNGLHGKYGEDGEIQTVLDQFKIPYTGSKAIPSAVAMNKIMAKKIYTDNSIKTPFYQKISGSNISTKLIKKIYETTPIPAIVKPSSSGSSVGVYLVNSLDELEEAVVAALNHSDSVLVEEFIKGKEATCGVIEDFRIKEHYPLIPVEIKHKKDFFDYHSKYMDKETEFLCPGNFSEKELEEIKKISVEVHRALGLRHYSRSDFIVHPKRGVFILETNSLPDLSEKSSMQKSLEAIGSNIKEFIKNLLSKISNRKEI